MRFVKTKRRQFLRFDWPEHDVNPDTQFFVPGTAYVAVNDAGLIVLQPEYDDQLVSPEMVYDHYRPDATDKDKSLQFKNNELEIMSELAECPHIPFSIFQEIRRCLSYDWQHGKIIHPLYEGCRNHVLGVIIKYMLHSAPQECRWQPKNIDELYDSAETILNRMEIEIANGITRAKKSMMTEQLLGLAAHGHVHYGNVLTCKTPTGEEFISHNNITFWCKNEAQRCIAVCRHIEELPIWTLQRPDKQQDRSANRQRKKKHADAVTV